MSDKEKKELKNIPVVILTNLDSAEDQKRGMGLGVEDYMVKAGHTPQAVLKRVERVLQSHSQMKRSPAK